MAASPAEAPAETATAARRFLICTAVTEVRAHPEAGRPELADDVRRMEDLFLGELGYHRGAAELGLNPSVRELTDALGEFATSPDRRPDDYVVVYLAAHGVVSERSGRHHLLLRDSDAHDLPRTALPPEELVRQLWEDSAIERLLIMIDACYAEEGTDRAVRTGVEARRSEFGGVRHGGTGLIMVAATRRKEEAYAGALSAAFDRAVRGHATAGHVPAHISLADVMNAIDTDPEMTRQRPTWSLIEATGFPAFLPNPRHIPGSAQLKLEEIDRIVALGARERGARARDMYGFFAPRARGTDVPTEEVWDFTGRHAALDDITSWLAPRRSEEQLCVVTGDPGSGKSSVLAMVAVLTEPDRSASVPRETLPSLLPGPGDVDVAINASHLSTRQLLDALSAAAGCAAESLGALTAHLQTRSRPLVVLIDSLDEALAPHETLDDLITPLTDPERRLPLRLLVGARPHIAARLPAAARTIDLDSERYGDPDAVRAYTRKLLCPPGSVLSTAAPALVDEIAAAVAEAAGRSFLVARITARTLAHAPRLPDPHDRRWRDELPRLPGEAMDRDLRERLAGDADRARDLLRPLAYAQGSGLPWAGIWPRLASALTGKEYTDEDIVWLRKAAGSYVVEDVESGGSVYRVYHRALIEYLREGRDAEAVQRAVTGVLTDVEHPYVRRYLALHAGEGGVLDPLVQDARFVLASAPGQLVAALPRLRTAEGRRAGRAVRDLEGLLRKWDGGGGDPEGRARLRLAAVCQRARVLADSCDAGEGALPWRARWAAWNPHEGARRFGGMVAHSGGGVVTPREFGAEYLTVSPRQGVRRWDLAEGMWRPVHEDWGAVQGRTLTETPQLAGTAAALAETTQLVIETADYLYLRSRRARMLHLFFSDSRQSWLLPPTPPVDFERGRPVPRYSEMPPLRPAEQVVVLAADQDPAMAVLRFEDGHLLVYWLDRGSAYPRLTRKQRRGLWSHHVEDWGSRAGQLAATVHRVIAPTGLRTRVTACAAPAGLPPLSLLVGRADGTVTALSAVTEEILAQVRTGHEGAVTHIDLVTGHPLGSVLVTAGTDGTVRLSSLTGGEPVRTLLTSAYKVASLTVRRAGGQWIVAAVTAEGQLHRVNLDSARPIGLPLRVDQGMSVRVAAFELRSNVCVSVQGDTRGLQLYDLVTGERIGGTVRDHSATALGVVGGTVCVGGSDGIVRFWPTEAVTDSTQLTAHEGPVLALGEIRGPSGAPALVSVGGDYEIRCWDVAGARELWRRRFLEPGRWQVPLVGCATTGRTADGRDLVATGEYGGRVAVLLLRAGLPVAEQEFTVPDVVTALTAGQVRGRDVLVVGTGSGRVLCWDIGAGRMYGQGAPPAPAVWTTALALAPDGSGRLAVGGIDGTVREWTLPTCRPLGPARSAHRGQVRVLAYIGHRLVGSGADHRLVSYDDGWERRMPVPLASCHWTSPAPERGLLYGDESGVVWRLRGTADGWHVTEALDTIRRVSTLTTVPLDGRTAVVEGDDDGPLQLWDAEHGTLIRRLRPFCDSGVRELAVVRRWPSSDGGPRPLLFARSWNGLLEYWDLAAGDGLRTAGTPLVTPAPHSHHEATLAAVPDGAGTAALLSLATWNADPASFGSGAGRQVPGRGQDIRLAVHDLARGTLVDRPCRPLGESGALGRLHAVRCDGRLLVLVPVHGAVVRVLDTTTGRWATLVERHLINVFPTTVPGGAGLVVVGRSGTRVYRWETLLAHFTGDDERPARLRPARRRRLSRRRPNPLPALVHQHVGALPSSWVAYAVPLPDGETYAVAGNTELAVVGIRDGESRLTLDLPSRCTALAVGPDGELVVGTRNGPILFDRP